jgi:hypothetical protein
LRAESGHATALGTKVETPTADLYVNSIAKLEGQTEAPVWGAPGKARLVGCFRLITVVAVVAVVSETVRPLLGSGKKIEMNKTMGVRFEEAMFGFIDCPAVRGKCRIVQNKL